MKSWRPQIEMRHVAKWQCGYLRCSVVKVTEKSWHHKLCKQARAYKKKKESYTVSRSWRKYCRDALGCLSQQVTEWWVCFLKCGWTQRELRCTWKMVPALSTMQINSSQHPSKWHYKAYILHSVCVCVFLGWWEEDVVLKLVMSNAAYLQYPKLLM